MSSEILKQIGGTVTEVQVAALVTNGIQKAVQSYGVTQGIENLIKPIILAEARRQLETPEAKAYIEEQVREQLSTMVEPCVLWAVGKVSAVLGALPENRK